LIRKKLKSTISTQKKKKRREMGKMREGELESMERKKRNHPRDQKGGKGYSIH